VPFSEAQLLQRGMWDKLLTCRSVLILWVIVFRPRLVNDGMNEKREGMEAAVDTMAYGSGASPASKQQPSNRVPQAAFPFAAPPCTPVLRRPHSSYLLLVSRFCRHQSSPNLGAFFDWSFPTLVIYLVIMLFCPAGPTSRHVSRVWRPWLHPWHVASASTRPALASSLSKATGARF